MTPVVPRIGPNDVRYRTVLDKQFNERFPANAGFVSQPDVR